VVIRGGRNKQRWVYTGPATFLKGPERRANFYSKNDEERVTKTPLLNFRENFRSVKEPRGSHESKIVRGRKGTGWEFTVEGSYTGKSMSGKWFRETYQG